MLSDGEVALTVFDVRKEVDVAIAITPNGPPLHEAVDRLITGAFKRVFKGAKNDRESIKGWIYDN